MGVLIFQGDKLALYLLIVLTNLLILLPETEVLSDEGLVDALALIDGVVELGDVGFGL